MIEITSPLDGSSYEFKRCFICGGLGTHKHPINHDHLFPQAMVGTPTLRVVMEEGLSLQKHPMAMVVYSRFNIITIHEEAHKEIDRLKVSAFLSNPLIDFKNGLKPSKDRGLVNPGALLDFFLDGGYPQPDNPLYRREFNSRIRFSTRMLIQAIDNLNGYFDPDTERRYRNARPKALKLLRKFSHPSELHSTIYISPGITFTRELTLAG